MFVVGMGHYGKVDQVPGRYYVVSRFFHVLGVPVVPLGAYLVYDVAAPAGCVPMSPGPQLPFSGKSVIFAWVRALLVLLFVLGGTIAGFVSQEPELWPLASKPFVNMALLLGAPATCSGLLWASYRLSRAGPERAQQLAILAA